VSPWFYYLIEFWECGNRKKMDTISFPLWDQNFCSNKIPFQQFWWNAMESNVMCLLIPEEKKFQTINFIWFKIFGWLIFQLVISFFACLNRLFSKNIYLEWVVFYLFLEYRLAICDYEGNTSKLLDHPGSCYHFWSVPEVPGLKPQIFTSDYFYHSGFLPFFSHFKTE